MKTERIWGTEDHVTPEGVENGSRLVTPGKVLIVVRGMILAKEFPVAVAMRVVAFNQDLKALEPCSEISDAFLFYWLKANTYEIKGLADEAAHGTKRLQTDRLQALRICIPRRREQKTIVAVLAAYDDLIENNTRRIRILEEMARMIYREWFVNFRFPGHESVRMVDSELGPMPEGWRVGRLEDVVVMQRGFDLPTSDRISGSVPIIAATGLNGTHSVAKVRGPGVVTGRSGSLGTVMLIWEDFWPLNTTLWAKEFRQSNPIHAYFVLQSLDLKGFNSGAAVPTLNRNDIHGLPTVLPNRKTLDTFSDAVSPLFTLKRNLEARNLNLRTTRDLLLPKLISGEIPVEAAEESAAEAMEQTA